MIIIIYYIGKKKKKTREADRLSGYVFSLYCGPATSETKPDEKVLWVRLQGDMRQNNKLSYSFPIMQQRGLYLFYVFFFLVEKLAATGISRSLMI